MAQTPLRHQAWNSAPASITGVPASITVNTTVTASLSAPGFDLANARIVWETSGQDPAFGQSLVFTPAARGSDWIEAEAQTPDGRRVFAAMNFTVK
jgi:hypothetical protein